MRQKSCPGCGNFTRPLLTYRWPASSDGSAYVDRRLCRYCGDRVERQRPDDLQAFSPYPGALVMHCGQPRFVAEPAPSSGADA